MPIVSPDDSDSNSRSHEPVLRRIQADSKDSQVTGNTSKESLHSPKDSGQRKSPGQNLFTLVDPSRVQGAEAPQELLSGHTTPMLNPSGSYWGSFTRRSHSPRTRLSPPSLTGRNYSSRSHVVRGRHSPSDNAPSNHPRSPSYDFRETTSRRRSYHDSLGVGNQTSSGVSSGAQPIEETNRKSKHPNVCVRVPTNTL
ncbi:uncharacterized protein LOC121425152 isoform X2 [Lytechinus variegatus]|uniref:uncharacterized protein LOC121425152 isoform X2 n=1 Tax=Lytechinus variegatus TaxID=7654 RepID=UPI001BB109AA|nr:uncharacterized protein LOC121425152 isoform X2 [Lytechinus variegatus]